MTRQKSFFARESLRSDRIIQMALRSPIGAVFASSIIDRPTLWGLVEVYLPLSRLWAAARVARGSVDEFVAGVPLGDCPPRLRPHVERTLTAFERVRIAAESAAAKWEDGFFGNGSATSRQALARLEMRRIRRAQAYLMQRLRFAYLYLRQDVPAVRYDVPDKAEVDAVYGKYLDAPERAYRPAEAMPNIETSRRMFGPAGEEYWLRFPAPSPRICGTAWARVHDPKDVDNPPTFIFGNGIGVEFDHVIHSIEDIVEMCRAGIRVVEIEWPWHGRRLSPDGYAGEPFFATAPMGTLDLFTAQVAELAVLVEWARRTSDGKVGLGGASLGALAAQLYAVHAANWPDHLRPDVLGLITFCDRVHELPFKSALARKLGMDAALAAKGWHLDDLRRWAPLSDATGIPAVDPENIVAILGEEDEVTPYEIARAQVERWGVPQANRFIRRSGHFSTPAGLLRYAEPLRRLETLLTR